MPVETRSWGPFLQQVTDPFEHSEEPTWNPAEQLLYFVDIHQGLVVAYNPHNNEINKVRLGKSYFYA